MRKILVLTFIAVGMASMTGCRGGLFQRFWQRGDACSPYEESGGCFGNGGLFGRRNRQQYITVPVAEVNAGYAPAGPGCGNDATCGTDLVPQHSYHPKSDCNCNTGECNAAGAPYYEGYQGYEGEVFGGIIDGDSFEGEIINGEVINGTPLPGPDFSSEAPSLPSPSQPATP